MTMEIIDQQRIYFASGATRSYTFRKNALERLKKTILEHEKSIYEALHADLHKSEGETFLSEIGIVLREIDTHLKHLRAWMRPKRVGTPLFMKPSRSRIVCEPYGVVLIMAPWNYPFQLTLAPLVGAIAAGNCAVLKPSPYTPHVSTVIRQIVESAFTPEHVTVVEGHRDTNTELLAQRWDYIFFTGSPSMGKVVMQAAAEHLTPVTLELGGKSPCIVDSTANCDIAARRIVWGKFLNAGQTCIAPDYLFVHQNVREPLLEQVELCIKQFYGEDPKASENYARIVSDKAFERIQSYLSEGKIIQGGETDPAERYIAPTLLTEVDPESPVMQQEIFGPVLPVFEFVHLTDVLEFINNREKPLALYYFGTGKRAKRALHETSSGGMCINDTIMHIANDKLPFGGVGNSGMGKYHGKNSFLTFSNRRSLVLTPRNFDIPLKYPPYKRLKWIKKLF